MRLRLTCPAIAFVALTCQFPVLADDPVTISGQVVDEDGQPVGDAGIAWLWSANGTQRDKHGRPWKDWRKLWEHEGEMETRPGGVVTNAAGRFQIEDVAWRQMLMAINRQRTQGGLGTVARQGESPATITVRPLTRVVGTFICSERPERLGWTAAQMNVPEDKDAKRVQEPVAFCGSMKGRFSFALPPGTYVLEGYGTFLEIGQDDIHTHTFRKTLTLDGREKLVNLGEIDLKLTKIAEAKFSGRWGNIADYYGKQPPPWNVSDARGVDKDVTLGDFKGKWVLVEFWGFG